MIVGRNYLILNIFLLLTIFHSIVLDTNNYNIPFIGLSCETSKITYNLFKLIYYYLIFYFPFES